MHYETAEFQNLGDLFTTDKNVTNIKTMVSVILSTAKKEAKRH